MEKKLRERRKGRRDAVPESIGLSDDDDSKMARKNLEILNAEESLTMSLVSKNQILKIFSPIANLDANRIQKNAAPLSSYGRSIYVCISKCYEVKGYRFAGY